MGNTHEHLEHAEHAEHAAHNPFDKRVAMTMAVVAACLASVGIIGHREHTATLAAMGAAGNKRGDAAVTKNAASDAWSFYQAKNIRKYEFEGFLALSKAMPSDPANPPKDDGLKKIQDFWAKQIGKYDKELPKMKETAEGLEAKVVTMRAEADKHEEESHKSHARTHFFDGGHLFIDLALVVCSIAILTKLRMFWYAGIVICVLGVAIALMGFTPFALSLAHHDDHGHGGHDTHAPASTAPETPGKPHGH